MYYLSSEKEYFSFENLQLRSNFLWAKSLFFVAFQAERRREEVMGKKALVVFKFVTTSLALGVDWLGQCWFWLERFFLKAHRVCVRHVDVDGGSRVLYSNYGQAWETKSYEVARVPELLYQWILADTSIRIGTTAHIYLCQYTPNTTHQHNFFNKLSGTLPCAHVSYTAGRI